ncbi:MAG: hypothetical protein ACI915_004094 [Gammaproteobacteria bacterium]|jgi:hypothetical protein
MRRPEGVIGLPLGTFKRQMDGGRFLLRALQKIKAEIALTVTAYNLTCAVRILDVRQFI